MYVRQLKTDVNNARWPVKAKECPAGTTKRLRHQARCPRTPTLSYRPLSSVTSASPLIRHGQKDTSAMYSQPNIVGPITRKSILRVLSLTSNGNIPSYFSSNALVLGCVVVSPHFWDSQRPVTVRSTMHLLQFSLSVSPINPMQEMPAKKKKKSNDIS